jgi:hypothetical protein
MELNLKPSAFRKWCNDKWQEHLDELDSYSLPRPQYTSSHYFNTYKYWLKREYLHQQGNQNV